MTNKKHRGGCATLLEAISKPSARRVRALALTIKSQLNRGFNP
jgi:hypothetical protein